MLATLFYSTSQKHLSHFCKNEQKWASENHFNFTVLRWLEEVVPFDVIVITYSAEAAPPISVDDWGCTFSNSHIRTLDRNTGCITLEELCIGTVRPNKSLFLKLLMRACLVLAGKSSSADCMDRSTVQILFCRFVEFIMFVSKVLFLLLMCITASLISMSFSFTYQRTCPRIMRN